MTTSAVRSFAIPVLAALTFVSSLTAQDKSTALLKAPEVRRLISSAQPADHARLSAHFNALAERQAADVKMHTGMQQAYANSGKPSGISMVNHCKAMVGRGQESVGSLRELSAYHTKLAGGATVPGGFAVLAPSSGRPSDAELTRLAATAETAADHRSLEAYFTSVATRNEREAADHAAYAKTWRGLTKVTASAGQATAHDKVAVQLRESAKEARTAASMHKTQASTTK